MAPVALVTGSSTGIGLSVAVHLAKAGFEVVATLRNPEKADRLRARAAEEGVTLDIRALDVESDDSVRQCVQGVLQRHGHIDVLVNNAGVGFFGSLEQTPIEALRRIMEVNFFGVWRVTQAVFPSMRERRSGRIITMSSIGGLLGQPFGEAYSSAKFAVEGFMESLAHVARHLGIHLSLIQPGPVLTEFVNTVLVAGNGMAGEAGPYKPLFDAYISQSKAYFGPWQTGDDVARLTVEVATAAQPHLRYVTSERVRDMGARKYVDLTGATSIAFPRLNEPQA
ncbi:SDR family oxidoreductase [Hyalangium rubrum]|uniref:SDR family oxidoreductase n=1 Tax=Hyalangium rubrum TaxID=3103134 RepID=A0ABU5H831_9BACT|nr:SDR family oxidoreductase [Hyalangium sp. s54d21]MDY7228927.1 SDR family oxidoreductase [Hyalangium sp. s54d21]